MTAPNLDLAFDDDSSGAAGGAPLREGTVRNQLSEAINTRGARNRIEAANLARAKGWL
jgi:two-component system response regulator DesR